MVGPSENTALLNDATADILRRASTRDSLMGYGTTDNDQEAIAKGPDFETTWKVESKLLLRYSAPLVVTYVLQYTYNLVTVLVAGRLGTNELAAVSLAQMTANITGLAVYEGLATSLDTLTSQSYGAGKKLLVGLHVQRMIGLMLLVTIPVGAVWICSPWILEKLVPEREVAHLAGHFLQIYLIGLPGYGVFEAGKRLTQAQGNFTAPLAVLAICAPLNILWNWILVFKLKLGFGGAAGAAAVSLNLQPIVLILYIRFLAPSALECWPGLQLRRAVQNWGPMIKLAIPGCLMVLSEWLAFEILTFSASYLGTEYLAAQSVVMTVCVFMYHIPFPVSVAASTRFGNLIGYGALRAAWIAWYTHYAVFIGIGVLDLAIVMALRNALASIFTSDPKVRHLVVSVLPVVVAVQLADALCAISNGLLRGLGRQKIGGWLGLGVYYLFAVPLSLFLTFGPPHWQLEGLWVGPCLGLAITAFVEFLYMRFANWEKAVEEARSREE